ncbi:MAG: thioredoxin peroxidase [Chloroflexi bacterium RBG_16_50_9]|nr:MAG: thioredoxin peroxidase [Chloroflexi bacterium RBG_16_50_9]
MAERKGPLSKGQIAPDFTLKDQNGQEFKLSGMKGKRVLLSFHPLAFTGICAEQMKALEANKDRFASLNTVPVGISVDSVPTKKAFAENLGIRSTRLLSDFWPHGQVARLYGVFREKDGIAERANILLDEQGKVIFSRVYDISQLPDIEEVFGVLKGL